MPRHTRQRPGGWISSPQLISKWIEKLKEKCKDMDPKDYVTPIRELSTMVENDPVLHASTKAMFAEALFYSQHDPTGQIAVKSWSEFLSLLNGIMTTAPEFIVEPGSNEAQGLVGFPINALLDWPMGTASGYATFSNPKFNKYFKNVLQYWSHFLQTVESRYVLAEGDSTGKVHSIPWLSPPAKQQMVEVALQPFKPPPEVATFESIFAVPNPRDEKYLGFTSWDQFFIREFNESERKVGDAVIVNACESAPLNYKTGVMLSANFELKGQPYSLNDMLNNDPLAPQFAGGIVYQAFLSALSYHRWHSPVDGVIEKGYVVDGTYFLENAAEGIYSDNPDPSAPNASQPFITSVAARAVVFVRADDPAVGLVAMVFVGMAEVSSCEITVVQGQTVKKGDQIGMFHFGGSTHCLVFQKGVELEFLVPVTQEPNLHATNVAVKSNLAKIKK